jgi:hypothetical protein
MAKITMDAWGGGLNTIDTFMQRFANSKVGQIDVTKLIKYRLPCKPRDLCPLTGPRYQDRCGIPDEECRHSDTGSCCGPIGNTSYSKMNALFGFPQILYEVIKADPDLGYAFACSHIATVWSFSDAAFLTNDLAPALFGLQKTIGNTTRTLRYKCFAQMQGMSNAIAATFLKEGSTHIIDETKGFPTVLNLKQWKQSTATTQNNNGSYTPNIMSGQNDTRKNTLAMYQVVWAHHIHLNTRVLGFGQNGCGDLHNKEFGIPTRIYCWVFNRLQRIANDQDVATQIADGLLHAVSSTTNASIQKFLACGMPLMMPHAACQLAENGDTSKLSWLKDSNGQNMVGDFLDESNGAGCLEPAQFTRANFIQTGAHESYVSKLCFTIITKRFHFKSLIYFTKVEFIS